MKIKVINKGIGFYVLLSLLTSVFGIAPAAAATGTAEIYNVQYLDKNGVQQTLMQELGDFAKAAAQYQNGTAGQIVNAVLVYSRNSEILDLSVAQQTLTGSSGAITVDEAVNLTGYNDALQPTPISGNLSTLSRSAFPGYGDEAAMKAIFGGVQNLSVPEGDYSLQLLVYDENWIPITVQSSDTNPSELTHRYYRNLLPDSGFEAVEYNFYNFNVNANTNEPKTYFNSDGTMKRSYDNGKVDVGYTYNTYIQWEVHDAWTSADKLEAREEILNNINDWMEAAAGYGYGSLSAPGFTHPNKDPLSGRRQNPELAATEPFSGNWAFAYRLYASWADDVWVGARMSEFSEKNVVTAIKTLFSQNSGIKSLSIRPSFMMRTLTDATIEPGSDGTAVRWKAGLEKWDASNSGSRVTTTSSPITPSGKWHYFDGGSTSIGKNDAFVSSANSRIGFRLENENALSASKNINQFMLLDNIRIEAVPDDETVLNSWFTTPADKTITGNLGTANANKKITVIVNQKDSAINTENLGYLQTITTDAAGKYSVSFPFETDHSDSTSKIFRTLSAADYDVIIKGDGVEAKKSFEPIGGVLDMDYMKETPVNGGYLKSLTVGGTPVAYSALTLPTGSFPVAFEYYNANTTDVTMVAVVSDAGKNNNIKLSRISHTAGGVDTFAANVTGVTATSTLTVFVVDSLGNMKLLSPVYTLTAAGLTEVVPDADAAIVAGANPTFNAVASSLEQTLTTSGGYVTVLVMKDGINPDSALELQISYLGIFNTVANASVVKSLAIPNSSEDGNYNVYLASISGWKLTKQGEFLSAESLRNYFSVLNESSVSAADVKGIITNTTLGFDLAEYNKLDNESYKTRACELFLVNKQDTITNLGQVQELLNVSVGTVLLATKATPELIAQYAATSGLTGVLPDRYLNNEYPEYAPSEYTDAQKKALKLALKPCTAALMRQNAPSDASVITVLSVQKQFNDAYVTAYLNAAETKGILKATTEHFADYLSVDTSKTSHYGTLIQKKPFTNIADFNADFAAAVIEAAADSGGSGSSGGGGGSSGSSGTWGMTFVDLSLDTDTKTPVDASTTKTVGGFKDVTADYWAASYIAQFKEKGIVGAADYFRPEDSIKREEFIKIIINAFALLDSGATYDFGDAAQGDWYYPYVASAVKNGLISGVSKDLFGVGMDMTRQDAAAVIYRYIQDKAKLSAAGIDGFADAATISDYAADAVGSLYAAQILSGYPDGSFRPAQALSRSEAVKIISLALQAVNP